VKRLVLSSVVSLCDVVSGITSDTIVLVDENSSGKESRYIIIDRGMKRFHTFKLFHEDMKMSLN
jgi:hypothetical protein